MAQMNLPFAQAWPYKERMAAFFNGKPYIITTLEPNSASTDSWATLTNQTPGVTQRTTYNDTVRAGSTTSTT